MFWFRWKTLSGSKRVLEGGEPGQLLGRIGPSYPGRALVAQDVDVDPAGEGLEPGGARRAVAIRASSSAGSVQRAAPTYSNAVPRWLKAVASSGTSAIAPP